MIPFAGNVQDWQICRNRRQIRGCQRLAERSWECLLMNRVSLGVMKMLWDSTEVVVAQHGECSKHRTVHFKIANLCHVNFTSTARPPRPISRVTRPQEVVSFDWHCSSDSSTSRKHGHLEEGMMSDPELRLLRITSRTSPRDNTAIPTGKNTPGRRRWMDPGHSKGFWNFPR